MRISNIYVGEELEDITKELLETIARIQREVDAMFKNFWTKYYEKFPVSFRTFEPLVDIEDKGDTIVIYADVPGFKRDEIKIKVTEDTVEINAEKSESHKQEEAGKKYFLRQRVYESFYRRINLPVKVRPEQARARLENGVLIVILPKSEAAREVEVHVE